jgi:hypothetical protein
MSDSILMAQCRRQCGPTAEVFIPKFATGYGESTDLIGKTRGETMVMRLR